MLIILANLCLALSTGDTVRTRRKDSAAAAFDAFYRPPDLDNISIDEDDGDLDETVADIRCHTRSLPLSPKRRASVQKLEVTIDRVLIEY